MSGNVSTMTARKIGSDRAGNRGKGRPKGALNKTTTAVKDMILEALNGAHEDGAVAYLKEQASKNPTAFLTLVGKVLPLDVNANLTGVIGMPAITLGCND